MTPYAPRAFRFVELCTVGAWRMKLYSIAFGKERARKELLEAAKKIAAAELERFSPNEYKVGFIGAHDGCNSCFVFVDFWGNENEMFHRVFLSRRDDPAELIRASDTDSSVCVWDLRLQCFEREAWIRHVLQKADAPDFDAYLAERFDANV